MRLLRQKLPAKQIFCFLLLLSFLQPLTLLAQSAATREFRGIVLDEKQQPVQGASVTIKGGSKGIYTRRDGTFSISAADNTTATISVVGYESTQVVLRGSETITITLNQTNAILNDVVVIGYGTQRKKDLTGSIASININETKKYTTSDISQLLQGRASGVAVNSDGQPGAAPSVRIRGFSTFGGAQPFYVVDGVPVGTSIRDFSPNDVESIQVLKDASAGAIYGATAANGVIGIYV